MPPFALILLACVSERAPDEPLTCTLATEPAAGSSTPAGTALDDCVCSEGEPECHQLWRGTVVSVDGDSVGLAYQKFDGSALRATVSWWILAVTDTPTCANLYESDALTFGSAEAGEGTIAMTVEPWEDTATADDEVELVLVTGGAEHESERLWFAPDPIVVSRTCGR